MTTAALLLLLLAALVAALNRTHHRIHDCVPAPWSDPTLRRDGDRDWARTRSDLRLAGRRC